MAHRRKMPKRPKKPKHSSSLASWERYDARVRDWHHRVNMIKSEAKKKESLIKKYSHATF